jgi:16S rRNA (adenine1518-N6/adenine1519-N6)-dimethyltransferase
VSGEAPFAGHRARKRFSQNFLRDPVVIDRLVEAIRPQPGDALVEIGPGQGALTSALLARGVALTAIELDRDLAAGLRVRFRELDLIEGDALKQDFTALAARLGAPRLRLVGNLPYNISSPLIFHALEHAAAIQDAHFMLQDEVVQRLAAAPGSKAWGRLGVMVQLHCEVQALFAVPPSAFTPEPKVNSRIVRLQPRLGPAGLPTDPRLFAEVVRAVFAQRRKTLRNTLKSYSEREALAAEWDLSLRPEQLTLGDFVRLANDLAVLKGQSDG